MSSYIRMSQLHFTKVSPTFQDFVQGIVTIGNKALVIDKPHPVGQGGSEIKNVWNTLYGYRHDPKTPFDPSLAVDTLVELFYKQYPLQNDFYGRMRFKIILVIYRYPGDLALTSQLMPRSDNIMSGKFPSSEVYNRDIDLFTFFTRAKAWLLANVGENQLLDIKLQVEDFRKPLRFG